MRFLRCLGWLALVCWVATLASPALAQYAPTESELTVLATVAQPGAPLTLSGDGFCASTPVTVTVEPEEGGTARTLDSLAAGADGTIAGTPTLPEDLSPGDYKVKASGTDRDCTKPRVLGVRISVPEPGRASPSRSPSPNRKLPGLLIGAAALLVVAALLLLAARRRRRKAKRIPSGPGSGGPPQ